jgi:hypothetical protein
MRLPRSITKFCASEHVLRTIALRDALEHGHDPPARLGLREVDVLAKHPQVAGELKVDYAQWFKGTKKPMAWEEQYRKGLAPRA